MVNEKDKKDREKKQKVRCADFAVSYYAKLEPVSDLSNNTDFRTGKMKLVQRPDETLVEFENMTMNQPGMTALRITEEIEKELARIGYPKGHACVLNFWPIGHNYWEDITPYMSKETEDFPG
jgi:hypothetical protein